MVIEEQGRSFAGAACVSRNASRCQFSEVVSTHLTGSAVEVKSVNRSKLLSLTVVLVFWGCAGFHNGERAPTQEASGRPIKGLRFFLREPRSPYRVGEPILLEACFENTSGTTLYAGRFCPESHDVRGAIHYSCGGPTVWYGSVTEVFARRLTQKSQPRVSELAKEIIKDIIEENEDAGIVSPGQVKSFVFDLRNVSGIETDDSRLLDDEDLYAPGRFEVWLLYESWASGDISSIHKNPWFGEITSNRIIVELVNKE